MGCNGEVISKSIPACLSLPFALSLSGTGIRFLEKDKQTGKRVAVKGRADIADGFIQRAATLGL